MKTIDSELAALSCGGRFTVDLDAITKNYLTLVTKAYPARVSAVVKANAYGLGVKYIAPALYEVGCRDFFVAELCEAFELGDYLHMSSHSAKTLRIFILNGIERGTEAAAAEAGFIPVLNSFDAIKDWQRLCASTKSRLPAVIQIDTGMARLGLDETELQLLKNDITIFEAADILYLISHLSASDEIENHENEAQRLALIKATTGLPKTKIALANSGGILLGKPYCLDLVRPGLALYGVAPSETSEGLFYPVMELEARVLQTRKVAANVRVGYGGTFITTRPTLIATIGVGYADGMHRCLSHKGAAYFNNTRLPFIGQISMDSITLDVTKLGEHCPKRGDFVEIIGRNQTVSDIARAAGTIPYEILTSLGQRYDRHYRSRRTDFTLV